MANAHMPGAGSASQVQTQNDLVVFNHWLAVSRIRAAVAVAVFVVLLHWFDLGDLNLRPVLAVCATLCAFSLILLRWQPFTRDPFFFFHSQHVVDLLGITVGIGTSISGTPALLFHLLYVLVIVPPSLVSVRAGLLVATGAALAHEILLWIDQGLSIATATSLESVAPVFLFYLVAHQAFLYGGHIKEKNAALAQLAARLHESRERLARLVNIARTLNSTLDAQEILSRVNRAALAALGADWGATFRVDTARGMFQVAAVSDPAADSVDFRRAEFPVEGWPVVARLAQERVIMLTGEEANRAPSPLAGNRRFAALFLAGLCHDQELVGFLALGYLQTEKMTSGAALSQLGAIADHATIALRNTQLLEEARQASAIKSEFVSTVSHELRTPLNIIIGYGDMLREGAAGRLNPEQARIFASMDARARELFELIEATLHVSRMETGRDAVTLAPFPLADLIETLRAATSGLPCPPGIAFEWEVPSPASGVIVTDRTKIALIVRNLVSNAFKFTPSGRVTVQVKSAGSHLVITVTDTGIGIAAENLSEIFEMFRQLDTKGPPQHGGVGLGLYIVKQTVERLNGTVEAESTPGNGTTFRVTLPGYGPDARAAARDAA